MKWLMGLLAVSLFILSNISIVYSQSSDIDYDLYVSDGDSITLQWEHDMVNVEGFRVYRAFNSSDTTDFEARKDVPVPNLSEVMTVVLPADSQGRVYFRVKAFDVVDQESPFSNYVSLKYYNMGAPSMPIQLEVVFESGVTK